MAMMYALYRFWLCVLWIAPSLWTVVASESGNSTIATMHQSSLTVTSKSMIASVHKSSSLPSVSISPDKTSKMSFHSTTVSPNKTSPISATTSHTVTYSFNSTVLPSGSVTTSPSQNKTVMPSYNTTVMPTSHVITPSFNSTVLPSGSVTTSPSQNKTVMPSYNTTVMPTSHVITPSFNSTVLPSGSVTTSASQNRTVMPSYNTTVMPTQSIMPSSLHSVVPTSTVHPMPPAPHPGNFSVKGKNGKVCLVADMAATFDVEVKSKNMTILLPTNATSSGECDENHKEPYIILGWNSTKGSCNFTMYFHKFDKEKRWSAANLTFSLRTTVGSNGAALFKFRSKGQLNQLSAKLGHSYQCLTKAINLNLTGVNNSLVKVSMDKVKIQPYEVKNGKPGEADYCGTHPTTKPATTKRKTSKPPSHAVAIAVGCSLAGLVVIVVIGYMIGRRRSRNAAAGYRKL